MSFNRLKYEYFFPSKVFRCACLGQIIENCCDNGHYSFTEIVDELNNHTFLDNDDNKIFSVKCGELNRDCIFVCEKHLGIVLFAKKKFSCTDIHNRQIQPLLITMVRRRHTALAVLNTI